jgi:hypothetical protein
MATRVTGQKKAGVWFTVDVADITPRKEQWAMKQSPRKLRLNVDASRRGNDVKAATINTQRHNASACTAKQHSKGFGCRCILGSKLTPSEAGNEKQNGGVKAHNEQRNADW